MSVDVAAVHLWGDLVGAVAWDPDRSLATFEYDPAFVNSGREIAPLTMPLGQGAFSYPGLDRDAFRGLPGLLADSLPDTWGRSVLNHWLASQGRPLDSYTPVEILQYIGVRGMGALEYRPAKRGMGRSEAVTADALADIAAEMVASRSGLATTLSDEGLSSLLQVGTSAGGMRAKAIVAWNPDTGEMRSGQVPAPDGFGYWIIKFDGVGGDSGSDLSTPVFSDPKGYGRIEYAYWLMARAAGIEMSPSRLEVDAGGRAHFMTKRFDRTDRGDKLHTQTYQALTHKSYNESGRHRWEDALVTTTNLCGYTDAKELYRRMVFNVVARNQDDHTKNISFAMNRAGAWSLAPAYDVTYANNPASPWVSAHQMTINGRRTDIDRTDLIAVAESTGVKGASRVIASVAKAVGAWRDFASQAEVDSAFVADIEQNIRFDIV